MVGLLTVTPGLDTALILRTAGLGHRRRAWGVVLGIQSGTLIWGVLTSLGVTALLTASHLAYEVLRWAGAAYLMWMGGRLLWTSWRRSADEQAHGAVDVQRRRVQGDETPGEPFGALAGTGVAQGGGDGGSRVESATKELTGVRSSWLTSVQNRVLASPAVSNWHTVGWQEMRASIPTIRITRSTAGRVPAARS
ncbi:LysE family translocator [Streptomyces sp. STR69]|uniref:LysE family translocator n=1 Tax=Streptomyces sp. STR69 TaxID=1796942 RepID=UPI0021C85379|nr:LysE family translocator [Streptomyces sp. STR69]